MKEELESKIKKAVEILKKGGVVIFPTDTVYGVGCRIDNKKAIERIYRIKKREFSIPFPILLAERGDVFFWANISEKAKKLIDKFWPGALTLILPPKGKLLPLFINKDGGVSFRVPNHPFTRDLIKKVGVPIVGTSANFHGKPAQINFEELDKDFISACDFVLKGKCEVGVESTVVDLTGKLLKILREGGIGKKEIYDTLN